MKPSKIKVEVKGSSSFQNAFYDHINKLLKYLVPINEFDEIDDAAAAQSSLIFSRLELPAGSFLEQRKQRRRLERRKKSRDPWTKMELRAAGIKVKDNEKLCKRTEKRKLRQKKKSAEFWREQNEKVAKKQQERQDRRKRNLEKRRDQKLKHKRQLLRKRGRLID